MVLVAVVAERKERHHRLLTSFFHSAPLESMLKFRILEGASAPLPLPPPMIGWFVSELVPRWSVFRGECILERPRQVEL